MHFFRGLYFEHRHPFQLRPKGGQHKWACAEGKGILDFAEAWPTVGRRKI